MPVLVDLLVHRAGIVLDSAAETLHNVEQEILGAGSQLSRRIYIPCCNASSPPGLVEAVTRDPWTDSDKYALGWVYFCVILLVLAMVARGYNLFTDRLRIAIHKDENFEVMSPETDPSYEMSVLATDRSTNKLFSRQQAMSPQLDTTTAGSSHPLMGFLFAVVRYIFYRPTPEITYRRGWRPITFPSLSVLALVCAALIFTVLYCFVPQPLYWQSIQYGSPPLAIRSGMIAVAMMPWIVALSMKANFISMMTGIGHERLNVCHRWLAWLFLLMSLIHTIPFYIQPVWDQGGLLVFNAYFSQSGIAIYGTGIAALVPAIVLCIHSLPPLRRRFYEFFVTVHVPISIVLLGMLFWHCANYLTSWAYLWSTVGIWVASYIARLFYLNWTNPWRMSWLVGEECAVTIMQEDAVKITIPTQMKWRPGQYIYLRMPGISIFENHPFTIASLCSEAFPSGYGDEYKDLVVVFRPFRGFTRKVVEKALDNGPWHTYRAFIDGPYGGMRRTLHSFDHVVLIAGGSGVTALVSHLLDLVKRMRDGNAVTKRVHIIWALKRPEIMEWFKEELRICREYAPPDTVHCQFYITAAKRQSSRPVSLTPSHPLANRLHHAVNDMFQNVANNRLSMASSQRHSALILDEAAGDPEREQQLRNEGEDRLRPLPQAHMKGPRRSSPSPSSHATAEASNVQGRSSLHEKRRAEALHLDLPSTDQTVEGEKADQDFGFPSTPTEFQKSLMRFAFMPAAVRAKKSGWSTEWGRPDLAYMLKGLSRDWDGRRACVFVCGPPSMRVDVSRTVASLQADVMKGGPLEEIYLHAENYAL
ncbi:hypothetical protein AMS68_006059 [Peltaster fructicola]|uniref:ferric-chelate reductase (NADPH) n=1 Tax=Peltaster fructicola TaxID=286661 RepID=A0A6H0Y0I2_9PEZI|nr:hypothetical protein AMS68_006059 [Peltaster fructicola]